MSCNSLEEWIALYVEGDLEPSRARNVESHLKSCASCQRFLKELEASQSLVKGLAAESLDLASFNVMRQRVMQEVTGRQARPHWWRFLAPALAQWRPAWVAAMAVVVALGFLLQWQLWRKPGGSGKSTSEVVTSAPVVQTESPETSAPNLTKEMAPEPVPLAVPVVRQFSKRYRNSLPQDFVLTTGDPPDGAAAEPEAPIEQGSILEPEQPLTADVPQEAPPPLVIKLITDDPNIVIIWLVDQEVTHN